MKGKVKSDKMYAKKFKTKNKFIRIILGYY